MNCAHGKGRLSSESRGGRAPLSHRGGGHSRNVGRPSVLCRFPLPNSFHSPRPVLQLCRCELAHNIHEHLLSLTSHYAPRVQMRAQALLQLQTVSLQSSLGCRPPKVSTAKRCVCVAGRWMGLFLLRLAPPTTAR